MEQTVWFYVGIIVAVIALLGIIELVQINNESVREQAGKNAVTRIKRMCNLVCDSPADTLLDAEVEFASGSRIYSNETAFCIEFKTKDCIECNCEIVPFEIDLTPEPVRSMFVTHSYKCFFEKLEQGSVKIECKG